MDSAPVSTKPLTPDVHVMDQYFNTDHLKADLKRHTVRGGAITVSYQFIKQLLAIVSTVMLARLLLPSDNGLVAMATIVTGFIDLFSDMGLSMATVQREKINHQQVSALFWLNVALGICLALITAALSPVMAWFYKDPRLFGITLALGVGFIFSSLNIQHEALLKRQMQFRILATISISSAVIRLIVGIVAALQGLGYWSLVLMSLTTAPVEGVMLWYVCRWRPSRPQKAQGVGSMVKFGGNLTGYRLVTYIARNLDNMLIGRFFGAVQLGLYTKAYGLLLLPLRRISEPIASVTIPALSRLTDSPGRYKYAYKRVVTKVCLLTLPLVAYMIGTADWLIIFVLGEQWAGAATMFALLGISGLVEPFNYTTIWLFLSQGRGREQFRWGMIGTSLIVVAILVGLPWGAVGISVAYGVVGLCIRMPLLFWYVGRSGPVRTADLYRMVAPFALTVVLVLLALFAFRSFVNVPHPLVGLIAGGVIAAIVSLVTLAATKDGRDALRDLKELPAMVFKK